ncbi:MAG: hypothetical protein BWY82_01060 [Verrucomicrobia bacterium ADurb.Bin474]|nr:MAG: hypothetical protein BWY82_01060 [Verrucomicrobia bacterium ADurb.Bin474]
MSADFEGQIHRFFDLHIRFRKGQSHLELPYPSVVGRLWVRHSKAGHPNITIFSEHRKRALGKILQQPFPLQQGGPILITNPPQEAIPVVRHTQVDADPEDSPNRSGSQRRIGEWPTVDPVSQVATRHQPLNRTRRNRFECDVVTDLFRLTIGHVLQSIENQKIERGPDTLADPKLIRRILQLQPHPIRPGLTLDCVRLRHPQNRCRNPQATSLIRHHERRHDDPTLEVWIHPKLEANAPRLHPHGRHVFLRGLKPSEGQMRMSRQLWLRRYRQLALRITFPAADRDDI